MQDLEIVKICPLGAKCREIKDGKIYECIWYDKVLGVHPQTGENIDHYECAIKTNNLLLMDNTRQQRITGSSIDMLRNEVQQKKLLPIYDDLK